MKKIIKRLTAIMLILIFVFNTTIYAFEDNNINRSITTQEIECSKDIYNNLGTREKAIFINMLKSEPELLEFHKTYVDPNFNPDVEIGINIMPRTSASNYISMLNSQIHSIGLPTAVEYALKAMGASMVAAIADGPLPVGDIIAVTTTLGTVAVLAANWKAVKDKWPRIIYVFKTTFANSSTSISRAFESLEKSADKEFKAKFNKSAEEAVNKLNSNDIHHIMNKKHNWHKFRRNPDWKLVSSIIVKVLKEGEETHESGKVYIRTLVYQGQTVVVRFAKDAKGFITGIGTAWCK